MNCTAEPVSALLGSSRVMQALRQRILQVAPTSETVIVTGESGSGKELVARAIHGSSERSSAPIVRLNCGGFTGQMLESELFGHERGAFAGAERSRSGRLELADGGTIVLDEIAELSLPVQAKLRRVLEEQCFERLGGLTTTRVDVRVVALCQRQLAEEMSAGRLRQDLYFRLAIVPVQVPPLRERREDVAELMQFYLRDAARRLHREPCEFRDAAMELLEAYSWPGNVRELQNIATRANVLSNGRPITADDVRPWLETTVSPLAHGAAMPHFAVGISLQEMERRLIESTLEHFGGHRARTAETLGIGIRTLSGKLKEYGYAPRAKVVPSAHVRF